MIPAIPDYVTAIFVLTVLTTGLLCQSYIRQSRIPDRKRKANFVLLLQSLWLILQGILAYKYVYSNHLDHIPPLLLIFGILPPFLLIVVLFLTRSGRSFIDSLPLRGLMILNIVRLPVEITLFFLFLHKSVPGLMTFEGGNLDILSGISAPIMISLGFGNKRIHRLALLLWNFICVGLLLNIVLRALLSAPFPFQALAFEQPNIAILYFPFIWLPVFIVPLVLFGHLAMLRKLLL
ncbi:hypothetical protein [Mucilaginibacter aquaedulcis]|uniref:hypothetical protein n=1 Tax=Mucilaginibacter aquaedulcis TaxID=1187081 RepID=UPI0025B3F173|nr:hypothetical protein [Mucilaginibacter aquaedulcis]MDN3548884.1 hypothetical protein [Mucilaginibacter aquaedulcis]